MGSNGSDGSTRQLRSPTFSMLGIKSGRKQSSPRWQKSVPIARIQLGRWVSIFQLGIRELGFLAA